MDNVFEEMKYEGVAVFFAVIGIIFISLSCCTKKNPTLAVVFIVVGIICLVVTCSAIGKVIYIKKTTPMIEAVE